MQRKKQESLKTQVKKKANKKPPGPKREEPYEGNADLTVSSGSTLLDLSISGTRVRGGGYLAGVLVEVSGPSSSGKTVLLCEAAGAVQRAGGEAAFFDPEARLNKQFAQIFDLDPDEMEYRMPDKVPEVFSFARNWEPRDINVINGIFPDSLAALSTDLEMDNEQGDKMGGRRAKEFSEELRKTCRIIKQRNLLIVASNQLRQTLNSFGPKYTSPGGEGIGFYSSLRLRTGKPKDIVAEKKTKGKTIKQPVGIYMEATVAKNSLDNPGRSAPVYIYFDYGIDDIRANLQFIKDYTAHNTYTLDGQSLDPAMAEAIRIIEQDDLEEQLREETIDLWEEIQRKFKSNRKKKKR